jgi:ornithine carbamoyltransferase
MNCRSIFWLSEKTRLKIESIGFNELVGIYFMQRWQDSNFTVGEIEDEVRYVAGNVDIILALLKKNKNIESMAQFSPMPVMKLKEKS